MSLVENKIFVTCFDVKKIVTSKQIIYLILSILWVRIYLFTLIQYDQYSSADII